MANEMTDRPVHDGASAVPLNGAQSGGVSRKHRNEPRIVRYFRETMGPGRPDPWLNRKWAVILLVGIAGWSAYVFIGRVCVPVFQGTSQSRFSVATAGGLLAGYVIVCFFLFWSYIRIASTGPGWAKDRIPQVDRPTENYSAYPQEPMRPLSDGSSNAPPIQAGPDQPWTDLSHHSQPQPDYADDTAPEPSELAPTFNALRAVLSHPSPDQHSSSPTLTSQNPPQPVRAGAKRQIPDWQTVERPLPDLHNGPRWCRFCQINKPDRTHHCRHCGTCIMQFDRQCVGWANHKFFMTFNFWAIIYWFYHLIPLVIYLSQADIDGQVIGVIILAALFGIFTTMMLIQHAYLIMTGKSTVESFAGRDQQEREVKHLNILFGFWSHNKEKRLVKQKWKEEFGGTSVDDRWRAGSKMDMWRREMGEEWYGWILPIGHPLGDGVHFLSNPRFGPNGEWLKKRDWPKGVE